MSAISSTSRGFTIVELIIVIVVIAILATIGVVGFSSISTRAEESKLQSDLASAAKKIAADAVDSSTGVGTYSADGNGIPKSEGTTYQYNRTSDTEYCLTATSSKSDVKTYHIANNRSVTEGACSGHNHGSGSPSNPAAIAVQKADTFVANVKSHAQANSLRLSDYNTSGYNEPARSNLLSANPGYV